MDTIPIRHSRLAPMLAPLNRFFALETAGGILLLVAAVVALGWANSPFKQSYVDVWSTYAGLSVGDFSLKLSLGHWVNDGLMVIFFLLVGLEIKREMLVGELSSLKKASLPIAAAIGGMVVPAGIYVAVNWGRPSVAGWGVPMATDIAFAIGVLALVGRGVPLALKVFLLAVAIVDDLGAVLVIALFYTSQIQILWLAIAGAALTVLVLLNLLGVHRPLPYVLLGLVLWLATLYSGVHATIAGVLLAMTIPASRQIVEEQDYVRYARRTLDEFAADSDGSPDLITQRQSHALSALEHASQAVQTPLARLEHALVKPVNFIVMPVFALANAGVEFTGGFGAALGSPVTLGVFLGLLLGKPIGIMFMSVLAIRSGIAAMPEGATYRQLFGISIICGIGFTMSLFIASLAFTDAPAMLASTKVGILGASLLAGVGGAIALRGGPKQPVTS